MLICWNQGHKSTSIQVENTTETDETAQIYQQKHEQQKKRSEIMLNFCYACVSATKTKLKSTHNFDYIKIHNDGV